VLAVVSCLTNSVKALSVTGAVKMHKIISNAEALYPVSTLRSEEEEKRNMSKYEYQCEKNQLALLCSRHNCSSCVAASLLPAYKYIRQQPQH